MIVLSVIINQEHWNSTKYVSIIIQTLLF